MASLRTHSLHRLDRSMMGKARKNGKHRGTENTEAEPIAYSL